jgi:hypothetical protein
MSVTASLLLSVALTMQPDSGLRLVNPHYVAVDATLSCGETHRGVRLAPQEIQDLTLLAPCTAPLLDASLPLLAFETDGEAKQLILGTNDTCAPVAMIAPLFGCERGSATASVPLLDGATYAWTAEGATITAGANTNRISATLGDTGSAKLVCVVTHGGCNAEAVGVIAIRKPLVIQKLEVPAEADAAQPVTINWTYEPGSVPNAQLLMGDAFAAPVTLDGAQRSYTFTPATSGTRNIELLASYAPSIRPPVVSHGRRRSAGTTLATATQCPSARATAKLEIGGCALGNLEIVVPEDVESGSSFLASVELNAGDAVSWTVKNGTFVTPNYLPQVEIRADDLAPNVELSVRVTHSAECERNALALVQVHPRAVCATNPPTATLSVLGRECTKATIQAAFVGTPPFSGRWHDGTPFETSNATISREVNAPGTFGMVGFRDAICSGLSDRVTVEDIRPDAIISTVGGNCTNSKIVATLIGTPPFSGQWNGGERFTTSEYTIEKQTPPIWEQVYIYGLQDANCYRVEATSHANLVYPPGLILSSDPFCQFDSGEGVYLGMEMREGAPPFSVEWSDGVVTTSNTKYFGRMFTERVSTQVEIVRATTATCDARVYNPIANIVYRPEPRIDESTMTTITCFGKSGHASLKNELPGATLEWTITNGTILSGQGTSAVTFQGTARAEMRLTVTASYPDGFCSRSDSHSVLVDEVTGDILNLKAQPATIQPGGTTMISYRVFGGVRWLQMDVDPKSRYGDLKMDQWSCTPDNICSVPYRDSKGSGTATVAVFYGGDCIADGVKLLDISIAQ